METFFSLKHVLPKAKIWLSKESQILTVDVKHLRGQRKNWTQEWCSESVNTGVVGRQGGSKKKNKTICKAQSKIHYVQ